MSKVKKQHYLPQFYLKNFADEKGKICVIDAKLDAPYIITNVRDVAQGKYYYDFLGDGDNQSLEKIFSLIESELAIKFKAILGRVEGNKPLTSEDKSEILKFLRLQFLRSDWMRNKIPANFVREHFKPEHLNKADKLLHAYIIWEGMFSEMLDYILNYEMKVLYTHPNLEIFTSSFPLFFSYQGSQEEIIERLQNLRHSSHPSIESNLFFPLTSRHAIYIYDPNTKNDFSEDSWFPSFVTSGLAWSGQKIYFRENVFSLKLYPMFKPILRLKRN